MKKVMAVLLLAAFLFSCAGCVKAYSDQAPTLYVTLGDQVIEKKGMIEEYERMRFPFFQKEAQIFCYPFALEGDRIPMEFKGDAISFRFDEEPKTMWLQYYKDGDVSKSHITEPQAIEPNGDEWPLQSGKNTYELFVTWENSISSRSARYVFCIDANKKAAFKSQEFCKKV